MPLPLRSPQLQVIDGRVRPQSFNPKRKRSRYERADDVDYPEDVERPRTRGECLGHDEPCPWVSCFYHLYLDVVNDGTVKLNFPGKEVDELEETCALDVADRGGYTLEEVGRLVNLTRERVRQLEMHAIRVIAQRQNELELPDTPDPDELPSLPKRL